MKTILLFFFCLTFIFNQDLNPAIINQLKNLNKTEYQELKKNELTKKSHQEISNQKNKNLSIVEEDKSINDTLLYSKKDIFFGESFFRNFKAQIQTYGPVPDSYLLGPGDEILVTLYGQISQTDEMLIDRDNNIYPENIGKISLGGQKFGNLKNFLMPYYSRVYSTLKGSNPAIKMHVSIGRHRKVHVSVLGEVQFPRNIILSGLNSILDAVAVAGGPTEKAALRRIQIKRKDQIINYDMYGDLIPSVKRSELVLEDNDVIYVNSNKLNIHILGAVNNPGVYEISANSKPEEMIRIAGELTAFASFENISVKTIDGETFRVIDFKSSDDLKNYVFKNEDILIVNKKEVKITEQVEINGSVMFPGIYSFEAGATLMDYVKKSGGFKKETFMDRFDLIRKINETERKAFTLNLSEINDFKILSSDIIYIYNENEFREKRNIHVYSYHQGYFNFLFNHNSDVYDYLAKIGGFKIDEDSTFVDIVRVTEADADHYAQMYKINIDPNYLSFKSDRKNTFLLKPDDIIYIRRKPNYETAKYVYVIGQVNSQGRYPIVGRNDRISDLIVRLNGFKSTAYIDGIRFYRKVTDEFKILNKIDIYSGNYDFVEKKFTDNVAIKESKEKYVRIPIDFSEIQKNNNSSDNIILLDFDSVYVPLNPNTVIVQGEINSPRAVVYVEGADVEYYLEQAGGLTEFGDDSKIQIIKANGKHLRTDLFSGDAINPGTEITVFPKIVKDETNAILSTIFTSLSTIVTLLVLIKQL